MPLGLPYLGDNCILGVCLQQETGSTSWDGDAGDMTYLLPRPGGVTPGENQNQSPVSLLKVDEEFVVKGVKYFTGSLTLAGSYTDLERFFWLALSGTLTTTGAADPWSHEITKADKLEYGRLRWYRTDLAVASGEVEYFEAPNIVVNSIQGSCDFEGDMELTLGIVGEYPNTTPETEASLPSVSRIEPVSWDHLSLTIDDTADYAVRAVNFSVENPVNEGRGAMNIADSADSLIAITRSGPRVVKFGCKAVLDKDSGVDTALITGAALEGVNQIKFANGAAPEHALTLDFGPGVVEPIQRAPAGWGEIERDVSVRVLNGASTDSITATFENGTETIARYTP